MTTEDATTTTTTTVSAQQQFCVRWNSHLGSLGAAFPQLLANQQFVDVTLACEGQQLHCHRLVLAACSSFFQNLLDESPCRHPIIILPRDIKLWEIQAIIDFMYKGEVNVSQSGLNDLLKCAEILQIRGLSGNDASVYLNTLNSAVSAASVQYQKNNNTTINQQIQNNDGQQQHNNNNNEQQAILLPKIPAVIPITTKNILTKKHKNLIKSKYYKLQQQKQHHQQQIHDQIPTINEYIRGQTNRNVQKSRLVRQQKQNIKNENQLNDYHNGYDDGSSENDEQNDINMPFVTPKPEPLDCNASNYDDSAEDEEDLEFNNDDDSKQNLGGSNVLTSSVECEYDSSGLQGNVEVPGRRVRRSEATLRQAAECVSKGQTFQTVSDMFGIPISTIRFFMARKGILPRRKRGRAAGLNATRTNDSNNYNLANNKISLAPQNSTPISCNSNSSNSLPLQLDNPEINLTKLSNMKKLEHF